MDQELEPLQRDVQRRLGRNLIRLQQIERTLKALVTEHEVVATFGAEDEIQRPHSDVVKRTLGQVAERYFDTVAVPEGGQEGEWEPDDVTKPVFRTTYKIAMPPETLEAHKKQWDDLVDLRNEIVHHFLEVHDIWTSDGCRTASAYLDSTYDTINSHFLELNQSYRQLIEIRKNMGEIVQSDAFGDYLFYGIRPDGGGVEWATAPIVALLQTAEKELSTGGWTNLDSAIAWMKAKHPDHTPKKYGCSTWRQVLHESKQFEIRRGNSDGGTTKVVVTYFRSKSPSAVAH